MEQVPEQDLYRTLSSSSQGIYKEKGSRFLSFAIPVRSTDEVKSEIDRIRKEYHDARHHCFAYRIGYDGSLWRANDDGEPSSTAGRPILGQLLSHNLSDLLIIVVRYFGGIKLGVPGLIRAYRTAAADAIENGKIIEKTATERLSLTFPYSETNLVMKMLKEAELTPVKFISEEECTVIVDVRLSESLDFAEKIRTNSLNKIQCLKV